MKLITKDGIALYAGDPVFTADGMQINGALVPGATEADFDIYEIVLEGTFMGGGAVVDHLAAIKAAKQKDITAAFELAVKKIQGNATSDEIYTFAVQEQEARAWLVDSKAEVSFISELASNRGISVAALVPKIITKANLYKDKLAKILGKKHKTEDQLEAAETVEEIEAIFPL